MGEVHGIVERRRSDKVDSSGDTSGDAIRLDAMRRKVSSYKISEDIEVKIRIFRRATEMDQVSHH